MQTSCFYTTVHEDLILCKKAFEVSKKRCLNRNIHEDYKRKRMQNEEEEDEDLRRERHYPREILN